MVNGFIRNVQGGRKMSSVSGINVDSATYADYTASAKTKTDAEDSKAKKDDTAVVYEKSADTKATDRSAIVAQMKAASEQHAKTLQDLVTKMMGQQANAYGAATDMWKFLASGEFTVDAATKAQAQADIAEDGYWGVEQTSDRILDFAKALSASDIVVLADIYAAREKNTIGISSLDLKEKIDKLGTECHYFGSFEEIEKEFEGKGYGDFKRAVADAVCSELEPFKKRYEEIIASGTVDQVLEAGAKRANEIASVTLARVQKAIGLYHKK